MKIRKYIKGFTLLEVLMVIVIIGIVSTVVTVLLLQGTRAFSSLDRRKDLTEQGTLALERISRELRSIRCTESGSTCTPQATDITAMTASEVRFVNTDYQGRGFRLDAVAVKLRQGSGATDPEDILANNVSAFTFEYMKQDGTTAAAVTDIWTITVNMTLTKGEDSIDLKASVHPRSFR
ncbi:MAG: type II secretion system protein [Deltaproteobacteria bacterium]|nr:type II secretion system protein [Deltaproteobacteria bacterium]